MKDTNKSYLILEEKNLLKAIVILAIPMFLSNLLKSIHSFVDLYFVSPLGDSAIASIAVTNPIIQIALSLAGGFMVAGIAIMSQAIGAKKPEFARKIAGNVLILCIIAGVIFNVLIYFLTPWLVTDVLKASADTKDFAIQYVQVRSFELVPLFTFFAFLASRQSSGDTKTPFIFNIVSVGLNVVLTWYLVRVLDGGVRGAALATLIANAVIMPFYIIMMFKDKKEVYITKEDIGLKSNLVWMIIKLGLPSALAQAFTSLGFLLINTWILSYGDATTAAFSTGNNINSIILFPAMGIGQVVATFVGQNIGAENSNRAKETIKVAMRFTIIFMAIGGLVLLPLSRPLGSIFLKNPESLSLSVEYMFFLFTSLPLMAIFQVFMGAYQGAGHTMYSLILATLRLWAMRIPLVYLFTEVLHLDSSGLWYAMIISNVGATLVGIVLYTFCNFEKKINKEENLEMLLANK